MTKNEKEVRDLIKSMGFVIDDVEQSKHIKYRLMTPKGPRILVTSVTASDHRVLKNITKQLRSWL